MIEAPPHVAAGIAILQSSCEDVGQSCSGNNSQLTTFGDGARKPPVGNARAHPALDD
jgi:hypothetical protein